VLVLAVAAIGCGSEDDVRDPTWGYISPAIIQPNCASSSCHNATAAVAGLDFSSAQSGYDSLLTLHLPTRGSREMPGAKDTARPMVLSGNPDQSRLVHMLRASGARRMPPDRPLAGADIRLIERWILLGARDDY